MAEEAVKRRPDRRIIHCLLCKKPQDKISVHLARHCLKSSTPEQIEVEVHKAKESSKEWVLKSRMWDYNCIRALLPDQRSQRNLTQELLKRGFFVSNLPKQSVADLAGLDEDADDPDSEPSADDPPSIEDCQQVLRVPRPDFLKLKSDLETDAELSQINKTNYRYWCEALLVFRHMQCPGHVEAFTDSEWLDRIPHAGRVVVGVNKNRSSHIQIALTQEDEAFMELYFSKVRPGHIRPGKSRAHFFISSSGDRVQSVSRDMARFLETYQLSHRTSRDVRRAVSRAANQKLTAPQHEAVKRYMNPVVVRPQDVVEAAMLLESLTSPSLEDDTTLMDTPGTSGVAIANKTFSEFVKMFPVLLDGPPPTKKKRIDSGYPRDRVFYDKWRAAQYNIRTQYLLSHFTMRRPSAEKIRRMIAQEGWEVNVPDVEEVVEAWRPAPRLVMESDPILMRCVSDQSWTGLATKDFGPHQGLGVVATRPFAKGDIVCDYHGKIITAAEGRDMMEDLHGEPGYLFFFKDGKREMCVDAQTFPCECHPTADTVGRRINHSSKNANLKPFHCHLSFDGLEKEVILFRALKDIGVGTEVKFDYGVRRNSFLGEGLDLTWLDD